MFSKGSVTWFLGEEALGLARSDRNDAGRLERCSSAKSCMMEFSASCSSEGRDSSLTHKYINKTKEQQWRWWKMVTLLKNTHTHHYGTAVEPGGQERGLSHQRDSLLLQEQKHNMNLDVSDTNERLKLWTVTEVQHLSPTQIKFFKSQYLSRYNTCTNNGGMTNSRLQLVSSIWGTNIAEVTCLIYYCKSSGTGLYS